MKKLSTRESVFVAEYLVDLNATRAALRAGYRAKHIEEMARQVMARPHVRAAVDEALARRASRVEVKADDVLRALLRSLNSDIRQAFGEDGCLKPIRELPDDVALAIASVEVDEIWEGRGEERTQVGVTRKVKFWSKDKAIELALKHLGLLTDKSEVKVSGEVRYRVVQDPYAPTAQAEGKELAGHG